MRNTWYTHTDTHTLQKHTYSPWQRWVLWSPSLSVVAGFVSADRTPWTFWEPLWLGTEPGSELRFLLTAASSGQGYTHTPMQQQMMMKIWLEQSSHGKKLFNVIIFSPWDHETAPQHASHPFSSWTHVPSVWAHCWKLLWFPVGQRRAITDVVWRILTILHLSWDRAVVAINKHNIVVENISVPTSLHTVFCIICNQFKLCFDVKQHKPKLI